MSRPQFLDVWPNFDTSSTYLATNEEPELHSEMIKDLPIERAAGICGGGDIPLMVLLPQASEVVSVDHSYKACAVAFLKAILLHSLGGRGLKNLFSFPYADCQAIIVEAWKELPELLQQKCPVLPRDYCNPIQHIWSTYDYNQIKREWDIVPVEQLDKAREKIHKWTILHGDLSDLERFGPFDLLYTSNAFEHLNRDRKSPKLDHMHSLLKPGGLCLSTCATPSSCTPFGPAHQHFSESQQRSEKRHCVWHYWLHKRLEPISQEQEKVA